MNLISKRDNGEITEKELNRLVQLTQEEEQLRLRRIEILGELAQLKGISLPQLMQELGINSPKSA